MGNVEILLWWLPPAIVTLIAMLWVSWLGRARDVSPDRSDAAQERFAAAIMRDLPAEVTTRVSAPRPLRERSTGIAVRPSQMPVDPSRRVRVEGQESPARADEPGAGSRRSA
ncbi:MAG: hypothetical protein JWQ93_1501 [Marmoricola sp.]|jgi:hypothetical protein|nr:hypothetical protein [Marmoricola sp.]